MKKNTLLTLMLGLASTAWAQETYQSAEISTPALDGTAKYVGMGGAMEALGGDISTIKSNPAGVGLFRHSWTGVTAGMSILSPDNNPTDATTVKASFDQMGFVYSSRESANSYINFAINYGKSHNFNQILTAANRLKNASQTIAVHNGFQRSQYLNQESILFDLMDDALAMGVYDDKGNEIIDCYYNTADSYHFNSFTEGYIGNFDFNLSGSINNRVFLGFTLGIKDVRYNNRSIYTESLLDADNNGIGSYQLIDNRDITGTGYDLSIGAIFRPIETSPFRFGVSISTPTFYDLTSNTYTILNANDVGIYNSKGHQITGTSSLANEYVFKLYTPWRFGLSLGHTVSNYLALGASYEYAAYGSLDNRYDPENGNGYDPLWNDMFYEDHSSHDHEMNQNTKKVLRGMHTLKLGAECKPTDDLSVRVGYNYVSGIYKGGAQKDIAVDSPATRETLSTSAFVNWKETHRFTCGVGYKYQNWNFDMAYQFSAQKGDFHPFANEQSLGMPVDENNSLTKIADNFADAVSVSNDRHQLHFSIGYTF